MDRNGPNNNGQLGFDALLGEAEADNRKRVFERKTAHLPGTMEAAIPFLRGQIEQHHRAMLDNDFDAAFAVREDAHQLARKLDQGGRGILAHDDAPGYVLARETASQPGYIPQWGQEGSFRTDLESMAVDVVMRGMFGIGATAMPFLSFEVRAVHCDRPFLSETGYRSFLGVSVEPQLGMDVDLFVRRVIEVHVEEELKGRLVSIAERYRKVEEETAS